MNTPDATRFPPIQSGFLDRLDGEADQRTQPPQVIDWDEIHKQAAALATKG